jgi:hypothetical protein
MQTSVYIPLPGVIPAEPGRVYLPNEAEFFGGEELEEEVSGG